MFLNRCHFLFRVALRCLQVAMEKKSTLSVSPMMAAGRTVSGREVPPLDLNEFIDMITDFATGGCGESDRAGAGELI